MSIRKELTVEQIMQAIDPNNEWYNDNDLVSRGKHWNIETSVRGYGKTTRCAARLLANYIVYGKKWLYLRRTDRLLDTTKKEFFDDARDLINRAKLGVQIVYLNCESNRYMITLEFADEDNEPPVMYDKNGEKKELSPEEYEQAVDEYRRKSAKLAGRAMSLSTGEEEAKSGGAKFRGIKFGVFDEFMAMHSTSYLGSQDSDPLREFTALYSIYVSIARGLDNPFSNDVYFFLLGNRAHNYNPILLCLGVNQYIAQSPQAHIIAPKNEEWAIEFIEPSEGFKKKQKASVQYKLAQHCQSELDFNFENKAKDIEYSEKTVQKDKPQACKYISGVYINGQGYGIYERVRDGLIYIGKIQADKSAETLDVAGYANGDQVMLVSSWKMSPVLCLVSQRFKAHKVLFRDRETQRVFLTYLDFIPK